MFAKLRASRALCLTQLRAFAPYPLRTLFTRVIYAPCLHLLSALFARLKTFLEWIYNPRKPFNTVGASNIKVNLIGQNVLKKGEGIVNWKSIRFASLFHLLLIETFRL